jgi:hypothetical protein
MSRPSTRKAPNRLRARSTSPRASTDSASDRSANRVSAIRLSRVAVRSTFSGDATRAAAGKISPGRVGPRQLKVPLRAVSARSASGCPPSVACARPFQACQLPRPPIRATSGASSPAMPATTPPTGAFSRRSMLSRLSSGTASSTSASRSPPPCTAAFARTCARRSAIRALPSSPTTRRWPDTGASSTSRSTFRRPMSMSKSGRIGASGSLGTGFSTGSRIRVTSGAIADLISIWLRR